VGSRTRTGTVTYGTAPFTSSEPVYKNAQSSSDLTSRSVSSQKSSSQKSSTVRSIELFHSSGFIQAYVYMAKHNNLQSSSLPRPKGLANRIARLGLFHGCFTNAVLCKKGKRERTTISHTVLSARKGIHPSTHSSSQNRYITPHARYCPTSILSSRRDVLGLPNTSFDNRRSRCN